MHIAIDGPSGAGKSTVARRLAKELGCVYMDTGAMYRAVGLLAHRLGVDDRDDEALGRMLEGVEIRAVRTPEGQRTLLNGEDVEDSIRTQEIGMAASNVAACPSVRRALVAMQRQAAQGCDVVMDGRDIGTNVLPDAEHKFFLTASPRVRAKRRCEELLARGQAAEFAQILREVQERDEQDMTRKESPLVRAADAVEVRTDDLGIDEVVQVLLALMGRA
ncbi:MAG: (d)CMP kinase [Candidatus Spyradocola sp.]|jgi:cytidylate kinase